MKRILFLILLLAGFILAPAVSEAQRKTSSSKSYRPKTVKVRGYVTKKGKYVRPHKRSKPTRRKHSYVMPIRSDYAISRISRASKKRDDMKLAS
jgi:hypothetical protein